MNVFKALYCNQYYELASKGKADQAQKMGTILSTIALVLFFLSVFFLLITFVPEFERSLDKFFRNAFGRRSGRVVGKFAGLLCFVLAYPLIKYTVGTNKSYGATIAEFNNKAEEEKKRISKKGLQFFVSSLITVVVTLVIIAIKLNFFD